MNSTLQCLAHTDPIKRYFLSGEYKKDLNRDNPLGTGGDLAVEFAELLEELWFESKTKSSTSTSYMSVLDTVYPSRFKATLGKHASQFVGYDQHDSQELATYLLDALHEDTNRVTKKPYIEKPEKQDNESDEDAAVKAWGLHLQREDSKILEDFMGQVKSRVECCQPGCDRVSTTFDPFMYLSVPIPGTSEHTLEVTFVPLDPRCRPQVLQLTQEEMAAVDRLAEMGFDRSEAAQAFLACDKNEALAANLLMDGGFGFGGGDAGNGGGGGGNDDGDDMYD